MLSDSAVAVLTALLLSSVEAEQPFPRTSDAAVRREVAAIQSAEATTPKPIEPETARYRSEGAAPR
ncbi:MAG: hypothetical protein AAFN79_17745 [Pseudomonadota bacterium]